MTLKSYILDTPIGPMRAIADEEALHLLEFVDSPKSLCHKFAGVTKGDLPTPLMKLLREQLENYFLKKKQLFTVMLAIHGTDFQKKVWEGLKDIALGQTCSYKELAKKIGRPRSIRAVANANGANLFSIIIPCHRVVNSDKTLGGFRGGINIKQWLLEHEGKGKLNQ